MKSKIIIIIAVVGLLLLGGYQVFRAQNRTEMSVSDADINKAKENFARLAAAGNAKEMGIISPEQIKSLTPAYQLTKNMITLEEVRKYKPGDDATAIIRSMDAIQVLLADGNGNIVSAIEFTKDKEGKMTASGYGLTPSVVSLQRTAGIIGPEKLKAGKLVEIPALSVNFFAVQTDSTLSFISLEDIEAARLKRGEAAPAGEVIGRLVPVANAYNGLPR